jgi:hypothetical protein
MYTGKQKLSDDEVLLLPSKDSPSSIVSMIKKNTLLTLDVVEKTEIY